MLKSNVTIEWRSGVSYDVGQKVYYAGGLATCLVAHTSNTFSGDVTASKWSYSLSPTFANPVGINTPTPAYSLDVNGTFGAVTATVGTLNASTINLGGNPIILWNTSNAGQKIYYNNSGANNALVGINKSFPTYELDVLGSGNFSSNLSVGSSFSASGSSHFYNTLQVDGTLSSSTGTYYTQSSGTFPHALINTASASNCTFNVALDHGYRKINNVTDIQGGIVLNFPDLSGFYGNTASIQITNLNLAGNIVTLLPPIVTVAAGASYLPAQCFITNCNLTRVNNTTLQFSCFFFTNGVSPTVTFNYMFSYQS